MVPFQGEIASMLDVATKPTPLYLSFTLTVNEPITTSLAPLVAELARLCTLFILQLAHIVNVSWSINNATIWANCNTIGAGAVELSSFDDGGEDDKHNNVCSMDISNMFATQDDFFSFEWYHVTVQTFPFPSRILDTHSTRHMNYVKMCPSSRVTSIAHQSGLLL